MMSTVRINVQWFFKCSTYQAEKQEFAFLKKLLFPDATVHTVNSLYCTVYMQPFINIPVLEYNEYFATAFYLKSEYHQT